MGHHQGIDVGGYFSFAFDLGREAAGWLAGACCDNFEPQGNSSWKLRYPFVGARVGWLTKLGCFTMDFAFKADHTATMVGACIVII